MEKIESPARITESLLVLPKITVKIKGKKNNKMRFWCLLNANPIYYHVILSIHGVKIINSSIWAVITYVIELFTVKVNYLKRWFEHFGFGCYQAVKEHKWTLYLWVDLAIFSGCLDYGVMTKTVPAFN